MPFFSFTFKPSIKKEIYNNLDTETKKIINLLDSNVKYYSKNTKLWKFTNKKIIKPHLSHLSFEKREKVNFLKKSILFCLPPSLGLGDIIEYGLAIKSIKDSMVFSKIGICFVGKYAILLKKYFNFNYIFSDFIDEKNYLSFETIFHVTLEINSFKKQKFIRSDIEENLTSYFKVNKFRLSLNKKNNFKTINKISIFPNSKSPIRTMTKTILEDIVSNFKEDFFIEIILDNEDIFFSNLNKNFLFNNNINIIKPHNLDNLLSVIESIEFGIFMDSGPLHVAKILNKRGVLIENTVSSQILLNKFETIKVFANHYSSSYCDAPCGLTNIINYNNKYGCFDSMKLKKIIFNDALNLNSLQRGTLKSHYKYFVDNPVSCLKQINVLELNKFIKKILNIK